LFWLERKTYEFIVLNGCPHGGFNSIRLMTDHYKYLPRFKRQGFVYHVTDEWSTAKFMKHLGLLGLHTSSQSGCHD
jgi:hypothetical protein